MRRFEKIIAALCRLLTIVSGLTLLFMMLLIVINTISRPIYRPILGTTEMVGYGLVIVICFGLAQTGLEGGHVRVGILVNLIPKRFQSWIDRLTWVLSIVAMAIIAWRSAVYGWKQQMVGEYAPVLLFPIYPLRYIVSFGFSLLCLALLINLFSIYKKGK